MNLISKRIAAVLLTSVFVFPIVVASKTQGAVLGVQESLEVPSSQNIASGAREVLEPKAKNHTLVGKALWDSRQTVPVSSNKFAPGSIIEVKYKNQSKTFLVEGQRNDLAEETVLILSTEGFLQLGVDPEKQDIIDVEVSLADNS